MLLLASPGQAADRLLVSFGLWVRSIPITDLERFADTGELTPQLRI